MQIFKNEDHFSKKLHLSLDIILVIRFQNKLEVGVGLQASQLVRLEQVSHLRQVLTELNACGQNTGSASTFAELPHELPHEHDRPCSTVTRHSPSFKSFCNIFTNMLSLDTSIGSSLPSELDQLENKITVR